MALLIIILQAMILHNIARFIVVSLIVGIGCFFVPNKIKKNYQPEEVAPKELVVTETTAKDNFYENNRHLAEHLRQLMEEDRIYLRPNIHIDDVAAVMGTNRTYVSRLMRSEFGQTFADYVINARIMRSKQLILTSSMELDEIASASGFSRPATFFAAFKKVTGMLPHEWKNEQWG